MKKERGAKAMKNQSYVDHYLNEYCECPLNEMNGTGVTSEKHGNQQLQLIPEDNDTPKSHHSKKDSVMSETPILSEKGKV